MKRLLLTICLISMTLYPVAAIAGSGYMGLKIGGYFPQRGFLKNADTGIGSEVRGGYYFNENIASEMEIGYYQTKVPIFILGHETKTTFSIFPISLNLVFAKQFENIKPYIKSGVGYYLAQYQGSFETYDGASFGYQVGAGISINNFGIEGKYVSAKPTINGTIFDLSGPIVTIFIVF